MSICMPDPFVFELQAGMSRFEKFGTTALYLADFDSLPACERIWMCYYSDCSRRLVH